MRKRSFLLLTPLFSLPLFFVSCSSTPSNNISQEEIDKLYEGFSNITIPSNWNKTTANYIYSIKTARPFVPFLNKIPNQFIPIFQFKYAKDFSSVSIKVEIKNGDNNQVLKYSKGEKLFDINGFSSVTEEQIKNTNSLLNSEKEKITLADAWYQSPASFVSKEVFTYTPTNNIKIILNSLISDNKKGEAIINFSFLNNEGILLLPFILDHKDNNDLINKILNYKTKTFSGFIKDETINQIYEDTFTWNKNLTTINLSDIMIPDKLNELKANTFPSSIYDKITLDKLFQDINLGKKITSLLNQVPKPFDQTDHSADPYFKYFKDFQYEIISTDSSGIIRINPDLFLELPNGKKVKIEKPNHRNKTFTINLNLSDQEKESNKKILTSVNKIYEILMNPITSKTLEPPILSTDTIIPNSQLNFSKELIFNNSGNIEEKVDETTTLLFEIKVTAIQDSYDDNLGNILTKIELFLIKNANKVLIRPPSSFVDTGQTFFGEAKPILSLPISGFKSIYQDKINKLYEKNNVPGSITNAVNISYPTPILLDNNNFLYLTKENVLSYFSQSKIEEKLNLNNGLKIIYEVDSLISQTQKLKTFQIKFTVVSKENENIIYLPATTPFERSFELSFSTN